MAKQHVVNVIPYIRLPWNAPYFFSYQLPSSLTLPPIGTWVSVPFRNATIHGLVVSLNAARDAKTPLRPLYGTVPFTPLGKPFIRFITAVAQDTLNHPSGFLKFAHTRSSETIMKQTYRRRSFAQKKTHKPALVWWNQESERNAHIIERARACRDGQHLILVPTNERISEVIDLLRKNKIEAVSLSSRVSQKEISALMPHIISGSPCIVVGTRAALFLPFARLQAVTIDDEEHPAFTQTAPPPRYHVHRIAALMHAFYCADACYLSACPSFGVFHTAEINRLPQRERDMGIDIIDCSMSNLTVQPLHPLVLKRIKDTLNQKKNVIIITAQSGYAPFLSCQECHYIFKCPTCAHLLSRETAQSAEVACARCGYREVIPPFCPHCNGLHLRFSGFGPARIIEYLKAQNIPSGNFKSAINEPACRVGKMNEAMMRADNPIGMVALTSADMLLARPWFTATERTFQELTQWRMRSEHFHASFCVQTAVPDHPVFEALSGDTIGFYNAELNLRKKLSYPPFARIIRIIIPLPHHNAELKMRPQIDTLMKKIYAHGFSSTPHTFVYRRKIKCMAFSIRGDESGDQKNYASLLHMLKNELPARAVIDVDPDSL